MIPTFIVLHQTGDPSPDPQFAKTNAYHRGQNFPKSSLGYFVGYHYFDGQDGTIKQARRDDEYGAHDVNCGCSIDKSKLPKNTINAHSIGVCLAGKFDNIPLHLAKLGEPGQPGKKQIRSLTLLLEDLQNRWSIPDTRILLHSETKPTSCPGTNLRELVFVERIVILKERLALAQRGIKSENVTPERKKNLQQFIQWLQKQISS